MTDYAVAVFLAITVLFLYFWKGPSKKGGAVLVVLTTVITAYWILFLWIYVANYLFPCIIFLFVSYFGICVGGKNHLKGSTYIAFFVIVSLLFIVAVCMVFGSYHIIPPYIEKYGQKGILFILRKGLFSYDTLIRSLSLLLTGFKHFFVSVDSLAITDAHFLQKAIGIALSASVVGWVFAEIRPYFVSQKETK